MLSEAERRKLTEIESRLSAEDPAFVQRFGDDGQRRLRPRWQSLVVALAAVVAVIVSCVGLLAGSVGTVVVALLGLGASAGIWVTHRR